MCEKEITTNKWASPNAETITAGYPTQVMAMDLLGPLPESNNGNSYVLVVGDYYSKWMEALSVPNQEAPTVVEKLVDEIFLRFSPPEQLHSDQGRQFESVLIAEVCKLLQIRKTQTTPYHPQCDGLVERFNRTLLSMLATCAEGHPFDWEQQLQKVCMAYNTSVQSSTGFTPFYLMFGRQARLPVDIIYGTGAPEGESRDVSTYVASLKRRISEAFEIVRRNAYVSKHHQYQKTLYDEKVHSKPYKPGDWVWLHSPVIPRGNSRKLYRPWKGPYTIVKKISDSTYRVQHLQKRKDRQVVHFNRLKSCPKSIRLEDAEIPTDQRTSIPLAPTDTDLAEHMDIEIVEGPEDDQLPVMASNPESVQHQVRRYPTRDRRVPQRYSDYVTY